MRIFIVGTGRSGTSTIWQACRTIPGMQAGHESHVGTENVGNWDYPENHIEVSSQLIIGLPILKRKYPDALWVHVIREREACVSSLARQVGPAMDWFAHQWWMFTAGVDRWAAAAAFYDSMNLTIVDLLPDDPFTFHIERAHEQWPEFLRWAGLDCDPGPGQERLRRRYNHGTNRGREKYVSLENGKVTQGTTE